MITVTNWQPATPLRIFVIGADFSHGASHASPDDYWMVECPFLGMQTRVDDDGQISHHILYWYGGDCNIREINLRTATWNELWMDVVVPANLTKKQIDEEIKNAKVVMFECYQQKNKRK